MEVLISRLKNKKRVPDVLNFRVGRIKLLREFEEKLVFFSVFAVK